MFSFDFLTLFDKILVLSIYVLVLLIVRIQHLHFTELFQVFFLVNSLSHPLPPHASASTVYPPF